MVFLWQGGRFCVFPSDCVFRLFFCVKGQGLFDGLCEVRRNGSVLW